MWLRIGREWNKIHYIPVLLFYISHYLIKRWHLHLLCYVFVRMDVRSVTKLWLATIRDVWIWANCHECQSKCLLEKNSCGLVTNHKSWVKTRQGRSQHFLFSPLYFYLFTVVGLLLIELVDVFGWMSKTWLGLSLISLNWITGCVKQNPTLWQLKKNYNH